jgi:uncharacterized protein YjbI with pentapeptide repeats
VDQRQQSRWRPITRQVLWTVGIGVPVVVLIRIGYAYQWTGFGQAKVNADIQPAKTLWDWLDLLIVPVVLALGGYLFTRSENRRTQVITEQRAETDRYIADQGRQDDTLQAYLDDMSELLKDKELHDARPGDKLSVVARARTLPVMRGFDTGRKRIVVQFLYEAGLIDRDRRVINLDRVDLLEAGLNDLYLKDADLSGAFFYRAYLRESTLVRANLSNALLDHADLRHTDLSGADLSGADLSEANLSAAVLRSASLRGSYLAGAILHPAALDTPSDPSSVEAFLYREYQSDADLRDADLSGADITGALVTKDQLAHCKSLKGATMPDGQKYEDWLKDKEGRGEEGENTGPS